MRITTINILIISIFLCWFAGCNSSTPTLTKDIIGEWENINPNIHERIEFLEDKTFRFMDVTGKWDFMKGGRIKLTYYEDVEGFVSFKGKNLKIDATYLTNGIFKKVPQAKKETERRGRGGRGSRSPR